MEVHKLRIKLGNDEFEAEGPQDYVEKQRDIFLKSIETLGSRDEEKPINPNAAAAGGNGNQPPAKEVVRVPIALPISPEEMGKIVQQNGDLITLSVMPGGDSAETDALLLLLLAHKVLRNVDLVQAEDLLAGLKQSGFSKLDRLDRVSSRVDSSLLSSVGNRRG